MVMSTRLTPRKSERGTGMLVAESEGGSTLPSKKRSIKTKTTTPMKSSSRQQKSKATPLSKTTKRGRPPTPVPSTIKGSRTTPIRNSSNSTKKNESSIPVTSSTRKGRPKRTPSNTKKRSTASTASSSLVMQPHRQQTTTEERISNTDSSQGTPRSVASPVITPQSKLLLNPNMSGRMSRITLGKGKAATPLKDWKVMDAARLKSLLKSRKRSDREAAMAQLSFDGTTLQDMIYSDFEEILEYMNIKVKKGNTSEELKLIIAEIMIESIEEGMHPVEKGGGNVLLEPWYGDELDRHDIKVDGNLDEQLPQQEEKEENGFVDRVKDVKVNEHGLTEQQEPQHQPQDKMDIDEGFTSSLPPGTDVTYKGVCVGNMTNVELHDYLVELDMKRGGSKAVRATRLREGLLHLKSETLAGIYNGKSFDDMSKLELREALEYEGEHTDGTKAELRSRLMGLLFDWANNDVQLIRNESENVAVREGIKYVADKKEKDVVNVVIATERDNNKNTSTSIVRQEENIISVPDLKKVTTLSHEQLLPSIDSGNVEVEVEDATELEQQFERQPKNTAVRTDVPCKNSEDENEEEDGGGDAQQKEQRHSPPAVMSGVTTTIDSDPETNVDVEEFFIPAYSVASSSSTSIVSKDMDIEDKQFQPQQSDTEATVPGDSSIMEGYSTVTAAKGSEKLPFVVKQQAVGSDETNEWMERAEDHEAPISAAHGDDDEEIVVVVGGDGENSRAAMVKDEDGAVMKMSEDSVEAPISLPGVVSSVKRRHKMDRKTELLVPEDEFQVLKKQKSKKNQKDFAEQEVSSDQRTTERIKIVDKKDPGTRRIFLENEDKNLVRHGIMVREDNQMCVIKRKSLKEETETETVTVTVTTKANDEMGRSKGISEQIRDPTIWTSSSHITAFSVERKSDEVDQDTGEIQPGLETSAATHGTITTTELPLHVINMNKYSTSCHMTNVPLESAVGDSSQMNVGDSDHHQSNVTYNTEGRHNVKSDPVIIESHDFVKDEKYSHSDGDQPSMAEDNKHEQHRTSVIIDSSSRRNSPTLPLDKPSPFESLTTKQRVKFGAAVQGRGTITPEEFELFSRVLGRQVPPNGFHHEVNNNGNNNILRNYQRMEKQDNEKKENLDHSCSSGGGIIQNSSHHNMPGTSSTPTGSTIEPSYHSNTGINSGRSQKPSLSTDMSMLIGRQTSNATPTTSFEFSRQLRTAGRSDIFSEGKRTRGEDGGEREGRIYSSEKRPRANSGHFIMEMDTESRSVTVSPPYDAVHTKSWSITNGVEPAGIVDNSSTQQQRQEKQKQKQLKKQLLKPSNIGYRRRRVSYGPCIGGGRSRPGLHLLHGRSEIVEGGSERGQLSSTTRFVPRMGTSNVSFTRVANNFGQMEKSSNGKRIENMEKISPIAAPAAIAGTETPVSTRILAQQAVALRILEAVQATSSHEPPPSEKSIEEERVLPEMLENIAPEEVVHNSIHPSSSASPFPPSAAVCSLSVKNYSEGKFIFRDPSKVVVTESKNLKSFEIGGGGTSMQHDGSKLFRFSGPTDSAKRRRSLEMVNQTAAAPPLPPPQAEKQVMSCNSFKPTTVLSGPGAKTNVVCKSSAAHSSDGKKNFEFACTVGIGGSSVDSMMNAAATPLSKTNEKLGFDMQQFGPKPGEWKCPSCSVVNDESSNKCPCCDSFKPVGGNSKGSIVGCSGSARGKDSDYDVGKMIFGIPSSVGKDPTLIVAKDLQMGRELCSNSKSSLTSAVENTTTAPFPSSGFKGFTFGNTSTIISDPTKTTCSSTKRLW